MAKNASGAAFISSKKRAEEALRAKESGIETDDYRNQDVLELQHHHLLSCLEKTTVRTNTAMSLSARIEHALFSEITAHESSILVLQSNICM